MIDEVRSAAWTRQNLSRGLAQRLIVEVARDPLPRADEIVTARSGTGSKALARAVRRARAHPSTASAVTDGRRAHIIARSADTCLQSRFVGGEHQSSFENSVIAYIRSTLPIHRARMPWLAAVFQRHAIQRWIERGTGDPRGDLRHRLDREASAILKVAPEVLEAAEATQPAFPALDGGLWFCCRSGYRDWTGNIPAIAVRTYLGVAQLRPEQARFVSIARHFGVPEALAVLAEEEGSTCDGRS
jgi:hypothetical protein